MQGLPIQTGEDTLSSTKYLSELTSTPTAAVPSSMYFLRSPFLVWKSCVDSDPGSATSAGAGVVTATMATGPAMVDLEQKAQAIVGDRTLFANVSQGAVNMCTSMAFAQAYTLKFCLQSTPAQFKSAAAKVPQLSAVFAYYFQRVEECKVSGVCPCTQCAQINSCTDKCNPPCVDCGSYLLSAATVFSNGVCLSAAWPYSKIPADMNTLPDANARRNALAFRVTGLTCVTVDKGLPASVVAALTMSDPVVLFVNLTPTQVRWMTAQQLGSSEPPVMPAFTVRDGGASGTTVGHAFMIDGFDRSRQVFLARNNFGLSWGANGRFLVPVATLAAEGQVHSAVQMSAVCGPRPEDVSPKVSSDKSLCAPFVHVHTPAPA